MPDKEFKVIKMLTDLGRRMEEYTENFSRVRKYKNEPTRAEEQ